MTAHAWSPSPLVPHSTAAGIGPLESGKSFARAWSRLRDWRFALAGVLLLAVVVRCAHLGHDSFSHAEAARVNAAWATTWDNVRWFPPVQYALLWIVRHTTGGGELAMRLPSAIAGVVCVVFIFLFTRRYFGAWSGVGAAGVASVHAELVAHSRLVKEFSIETVISILICWAGVEACRARSARGLQWFTGAAVCGASCTYTWSLLVAGWMPILAYVHLRDVELRKQSIPRLGRSSVVIGLALALWYLWFFDCYNREGAAHDYGILRGAWPESYRWSALATWFMHQSYGAVQFVLGIGDLYAPINWLIGGYLILLVAAAWTEVRTHAPGLLVALGSVTMMAALAGAVRAWPYGRFHTLVFLVPPCCVVCGVGLKVMVERVRMPLPVLVLVAVCLLNPAARAVKNTVVYPSESEHLRPILEYVGSQAQPGDGIFSYYAGCHAVIYYWSRADVPVLYQPTNDRDQLPVFAERFDEFASKHDRVWFVFTHNWRNEQVEWIEHLKSKYVLVDHVENATASAHLFQTK